MRVRVIVPVAFNGTHRVYEGEEYDVPDDTQLGSWAERIDDTPAPVIEPRRRERKNSAPAVRAADLPIGE